MAKQDPPESDSGTEESENSEKSSSEEEEEEHENRSIDVDKRVVPEYEKQRLSRIAENKARLEAMGLRKMASSLMVSTQKSILSKGKQKDDDDDVDYKPDDEDEDDDEDDEDFVASKSSTKSRKNKVNDKSSKNTKKNPVQKHLGSDDFVDDDNELMQAIALSLQDSAKDAALKERKGNAQYQEDARRRKRKKSFSSRVQMTEDEIILHFFQFDGAGRGFITRRDLRRVATAHDFTWTDKELADMIHFFNTDGDGKLNLDDFRKIVGRCNMIQGSEDY